MRPPWRGFFTLCPVCDYWEPGHHDACSRCHGSTRLFDDGHERLYRVGQLVWAEENVSKTARRVTRWVPLRLSWVSAIVVEGYTQDKRRARAKITCPASVVRTERPELAEPEVLDCQYGVEHVGTWDGYPWEQAGL